MSCSYKYNMIYKKRAGELNVQKIKIISRFHLIFSFDFVLLPNLVFFLVLLLNRKIERISSVVFKCYKLIFHF